MISITTCQAIAKVLRCSERTVQRLAAKGEIPSARRRRRRWEFDESAVVTWIAEEVMPAASPGRSTP